MSEANEEHLQSMYRVMQFTIQTASFGLTLKINNENKVVGYTDANWADKETRKSVSGHTIYYSGAFVSWKCKTQKCTTLSSTES
jgi:hypothetical protein